MWLENIHGTRESILKTWALAICFKDLIFTLTLIIVCHHLISFRGGCFDFPVFSIEHGLLSSSLQHSLRFNHSTVRSVSVSAIPLEAKTRKKPQLPFNPLKFNKSFAARAIPDGQTSPALSSQPRSAQMQKEGQTLLCLCINAEKQRNGFRYF